MSKFADLLKSLKDAEDDNATLVKAVGASPAVDDKQIEAAATEGGALSPEDEEAAEAAAAAAAAAEAAKGEAAPAGEGGKPAVLAKSEGAEAGAGEDPEFIDATELIKSMQATLDEHGDVLAKSFGPILSVVKSQGEMIKSLNARIEQLAGAGRGRKTVVMALERPAIGDLAKSQGAAQAEEGTLTPEVFLTKANAAFDAKAITGLELTTISVSMRENKPIDAALIRKVALAG